jgi:hypothetical protein
MVAVRADITVDTDIFDAIIETAREAPRAVDTLINQSLRRDTQERLIPQLQEEPGPVVYPIVWTTEKQRKAFFATDGFGAGIPTRRTGRTRSGWQLVGLVTEQGAGSLAVENNEYAAQFVYFPHQQQFHTNTGWMGEERINELVFAESERLADALIVAWDSIVSFEGKLV